MTDSVRIDWAGRPVHIEQVRINAERMDRPLVVFLHEGLGSVSMWRDFPQTFCDAADVRGLVYSRPGYGRSTPRGSDERWGVDFLHRQALEVLPRLLDAVHVDEPVWLFGHSDGGSIALLFAAAFPARVSGLVVLAPHIVTEDVGIDSIRLARDAYLHGDLRSRLARHHDDVDSAFHGWNGIWLDPAFRAWTIEREIESIMCPVLAIQGLEDEYGTMAQLRGIARRVPRTTLIELAACRHSPHRDQPGVVCATAGAFIHDNDRRQA